MNDSEPVRALLAWSADLLTGPTDPPPGLSVRIDHRGYTVAVHPSGGAERTSAPPIAPGADLAAYFLSVKERIILRELAARGPCTAADLADECRAEVSRTVFWTLWSNLQQRGLVADAAGGSGYELAMTWVRELVAETDTRRAAP